MALQEQALSSKSGAQISARSFIQSLLILIVLMLVAGVLTRIVPAGLFQRVEQEGRSLIVPDSYAPISRPDYPVWRWFTAPLEVLWGPDAITLITILIFLMMVGVSFAVLEGSGLLRTAIGRIVGAFGARKYALLLGVCFFFMLIGAFFGIFEEVVPLVPLMITLSYSLGWDSLVGLGMSILATNLGFSAAVTNPFTLGVAQNLAGLPLFSGYWFRIPIFLVIYVLLAVFLTRYARRIERNPQASPVYTADQVLRSRLAAAAPLRQDGAARPMKPALIWLAVFMVLIVATLLAGPLVPFLTQVSLPLVGLLFLIGGVGAGMLAGCRGRAVARAAGQGLLGILPAIPLILLAASIKHIVASGGIMDTLLYRASQSFEGTSPFGASVIIYFLALMIEFFIGSGSAKAFLMMPILLPLADLVGVTRQVAVTAYCFGDGFSNLAYPTNPVLLVCLGLTVVSYPRWLRWTLPLWGGILLVTLLFLGLGVALNLGPF